MFFFLSEHELLDAIISPMGINHNVFFSILMEHIWSVMGQKTSQPENAPGKISEKKIVPILLKLNS